MSDILFRSVELIKSGDGKCIPDCDIVQPEPYNNFLQMTQPYIDNNWECPTCSKRIKISYELEKGK